MKRASPSSLRVAGITLALREVGQHILAHLFCFHNSDEIEPCKEGIIGRPRLCGPLGNGLVGALFGTNAKGVPQ